MLDYIIVGQGLGGSVLAWSLLKRGKKILVVDKGENSSSAVAGGLYNPVTGKRMVRTWKAKTLFPYLENFYKQIESELHTKFLHPKPIYKPFSSIEEQNTWVSSKAAEEDFVQVHLKFPYMDPFLNSNFGGFETKYSGYLEVPRFLSIMKDFLISKKSFLGAELRIEDLKLEKDFVRWNNLESKKIIFCEGFSMTENTFFNWIPFSPVKGETITVSIPGFPETHIVNKDVFILPLGENLFKVGATFDYDLKPGVTDKGRNELVEKLQKLIQVPFQVVDQQAGIRPASKDRRPLIGLHPNLEMIGLFNGLGTKGVSLAPYFADQFADFLDGKEELDPDVNIQRYYSLYYDLK